MTNVNVSHAKFTMKEGTMKNVRMNLQACLNQKSILTDMQEKE